MKEIITSTNSLLQVRGVSVDYWSQDRWVNVIDRISFDIQTGESVGLVGESGCGKTTMLYSMVGYVRPNSRIREGSVLFQGEELLTQPKSKLQHIRGKLISIVPQNPTTALSPGMRIGKQITETLEAHHWKSEKYDVENYAIELLKMVSLPSPEKILPKYPHQISGGQQQRVLIAMAISCNPKLLLLDEPTTGLDVTTQAQILDLLTELRSVTGMSMLYVTHNLGVVAQICDRIGVMYAGYLVEVATRHTLFRYPSHPYTQGLISAVPRISTPNVKQSLILKGLLNRSELPAGCPFAPRCDFVLPRCLEETQELISIERDHQIACWRWQEIPSFTERISRITGEVPQQSISEGWKDQRSLLTIENLQVGYTTERIGRTFKRKPKAVVEEITLDIRPGETFALVGESGSGKTTVARAVSGLLPYVSGIMNIEDRYDLKVSMRKRSDDMLRSVQYIFQNPDASLNPRQRVSLIVGRPLQKFFKLSGEELRQKVIRLLADVHLDAGFYDRFPDELSGGERQRIAIARALAAEPKLLLCDEVLSALDVSVQANILKLLAELQVERGIAFLFISHDLAIVRSLAHRVGVMYWGMLFETGRVEEVFNPPYHPYTYLLLSAVPEPDPDKVIPTVRMDTGLILGAKKMTCPFAPRCPVKVGRVCEVDQVPWQRVSQTHQLRCFHSIEKLLSIQKKIV
jgi:peptide/nickel transport system ATP-binding protein